MKLLGSKICLKYRTCRAKLLLRCLQWSCASKNDLNCTCCVQLGTLEDVTAYSQSYSWAACDIQGTVCPKGCLYFADNHINSATRGQKTACCVFVLFFFNAVVINMCHCSPSFIYSCACWHKSFCPSSGADTLFCSPWTPTSALCYCCIDSWSRLHVTMLSECDLSKITLYIMKIIVN